MDDLFLRNLPKIELHAHLNGSLSLDSIRELERELYNIDPKKNEKLHAELITFEESLSECFKKFSYMHQLTATPRGLRRATQMVIRDFAKDNVIYLELRTTPKSNDHMNHLEYLKCVLQAIEEAEEVLAKKIYVKLLPSFDRARPISEARSTLKAVSSLLSEYGNLIKGLDFSGDPTKGNFADLMDILKPDLLGLKRSIHCAEIDNELEVALMFEFGMDRCGHGTYLTQQQREFLGKHNIAVECCLTSNVKSKTVPSYEAHHFNHVFDAKYPVVLCTDDCGIFNTTLSEEFIIAVKTFNLQLEDIKKLCLNAASHAFADQSEKTILHNKINDYFANFEK